jgi:hypothetical protein
MIGGFRREADWERFYKLYCEDCGTICRYRRFGLTSWPPNTLTGYFKKGRGGATILALASVLTVL